MHSDLLQAIGLSIVAASLLAYVARLFRQPLILGYIGAGILLGPQGFRLITNPEEITLLSELGLAFLLFIVGLEIDIKKFSRSGGSSAVIGAVQVVACSVLGVLAAYALGYSGMTAGYIGVTLSFSSTMIVVKLLSDRKELDTLPGRISLGILLVQDVLAIFVLAAQGNLDDPSILPVAASIVAGLGLVAVSFVASRYLLPSLFRSIARNAELILVLSISWCFVMCWLALVAGFSIAMGALIAGVSISTYPYSHEVIAKIRSLRDFFVTLFFVSLGMQIVLSSGSALVDGLVLSAFIIAGRVLTIVPVAMMRGLGVRVGVLSALALAQSSEFSLVIAALGVGYGHITGDVVSLIALTLVFTSTTTTYLVHAQHRIARWFVAAVERSGLRSGGDAEESAAPSGQEGEVILLGCHRLGSAIVEELQPSGLPLRVFDFNPVVLRRLKERGIPASYVDISNFDALEAAGIDRAGLIICTLSDEYLRGTSNRGLLRFLKSRHFETRVILQATSAEHALELYGEGADYVMFPSGLTAKALATVLGEQSDGGWEGMREAEIVDLRSRKEVL